jgi:hypothetical protein
MWHQRPEVLEIVRYVQDFRAAHRESFEAKNSFDADDLSEYGQFILGELIYEPEFGGAWGRLADPKFAEEVVLEVRLLRPRLEQYIARNSEAAQAVS